MTKFLTYAFLFMVLVGGCAEAFGSTSTVPKTTVYVPDTSITSSTEPAIAGPVTPDASTNNTVKRSGSNTGSSITSSDDIDCDQAEDLYDSGDVTDDIADYCDYGPDGEWDTEDDYDSWEE